MNAEDKKELIRLIIQLLQDYELAAMTVIGEFSCTIEAEEQALEEEIQEYKDKFKKLLEEE